MNFSFPRVPLNPIQAPVKHVELISLIFVGTTRRSLEPELDFSFFVLRLVLRHLHLLN